MTQKRLEGLLKKLNPPARCAKCQCLLFTPALLCDSCLHWQHYMDSGDVPTDIEEYPEDTAATTGDSTISSVQVRSFGDTLCIM